MPSPLAENFYQIPSRCNVRRAPSIGKFSHHCVPAFGNDDRGEDLKKLAERVNLLPKMIHSELIPCSTYKTAVTEAPSSRVTEYAIEQLRH